jgi:hypothetical protein
MMRTMTAWTTLALLVVAGGLVQAEDAKGKIKTVDTGRKELVIKGLVNDSTYELGQNASVWLDGRRAKLADLAPDDRAVIFYDKRGDNLVAKEIRALRAAQETSGTVNDVLPEKREVHVKGTVQNTTYELAKDGTVWAGGKMVGLKDVRPGDEVLITYVKRGEHFMANDVTVLKRK